MVTDMYPSPVFTGFQSAHALQIQKLGDGTLGCDMYEIFVG